VPLTYQWRRDGVDLTDGVGISGVNTPHLTLAGVTADDEGFYDCVVSNPQGTRVSSSALLGVGGAGGTCPEDTDGDSDIDLQDLLNVLARFGTGC